MPFRWRSMGWKFQLVVTVAIIFIMLLMVLVVTARGESTAAMTGIDLTPSQMVMQKGTTQSFQATASYNDGTTRNVTQQVSWASSDSSVATVTASSAGVLVRAVSPGTATITASLVAINGSTTVTVTASGCIWQQATECRLFLGPSATITLGQFNISKGKFSGGAVPGLGAELQLNPERWYSSGIALDLQFIVGGGQPNQATPSLMLSFANYFRLGFGLPITETDGPVSIQKVIYFGIGSNVTGGKP
jgi:hypothetical protein